MFLYSATVYGALPGWVRPTTTTGEAGVSTPMASVVGSNEDAQVGVLPAELFFQDLAFSPVEIGVVESHAAALGLGAGTPTTSTGLQEAACRVPPAQPAERDEQPGIERNRLSRP